jgi:RimJ/RimL family protein N-acetyltransferase
LARLGGEKRGEPVLRVVQVRPLPRNASSWKDRGIGLTCPVGPGGSTPATVRALDRWTDLGEAPLPDLSPWFQPFIPHFVAEVLRCGGHASGAWEGDALTGVWIYHDAEKVGTIFTRSPAVAERFAGLQGSGSLFSEIPLGVPGELYHIYAMDLESGGGSHRFRHLVRAAEPSDAERILPLIREIHGPIDDHWLRPISPNSEKGFLVEVSGEIAGVGWISVVNGNARLHALSVRPPYRRTGIASDLWYARILWARSAGARRVLCEISEGNVASRRVAEQGGMRPVGQMFRYDRP